MCETLRFSYSFHFSASPERPSQLRGQVRGWVQGNGLFFVYDAGMNSLLRAEGTETNKQKPNMSCLKAFHHSLFVSLQRAHQTSARTATFWSSGCLAPTPTTPGFLHVKPPSIVPSLASTAAAAAACLSSTGHCPFLSSCLCRAGPAWPLDPPLPHALCLCPRPWASGKAFCVWDGSDRGRSLAPVCASWFSLALPLSISITPLWSIVL